MEDQKQPASKAKPGRKPVKGNNLRKFLATLEAETIKELKLAAIQDGCTASEILEKAAVHWLQRRKSETVKS